MTIWDKIYKDFLGGGQAWATLSEEIDSRFKGFINKKTFKQKSVLDIGCGTGKYLRFLQQAGFKVTGIDSSKTAVSMSKESLGNEADIFCVSMFDFEIAPNTFDLIISISTIHHGTKDQVKQLIEKVYRALIEGGKIFITLPDFESGKKWHTFKEHQEIAPGTYAPLSGPEKGLAHSFYTKVEVEQLFASFSEVMLELDEKGRWFVTAVKSCS